ncbi:MAG: mannose system component [Lacrimispora sp.]|nr:mannose system component [Lacrimispora sp.]
MNILSLKVYTLRGKEIERRNMKRIILVTHGDFAKGILTSVKLVMGETDYIDFVSISAKETIPEITGMIEAKMRYDSEEAITIIISDIAGGSTTRAAMELLSPGENIYLVTGLNLGLLLEIAMLPMSGEKSSDRQLLKSAIENSRNTIALVNDLLDESRCETDDLEEL